MIISILLLTFMVTVMAQVPTTGLIAHYPLKGDALDYSGSNYHGSVYGALAFPDRFGYANSVIVCRSVDIKSAC